ncbi:9502_t:CDS:2 [Funneliformis geosporum]|uniref:9502_t:CDS:1 n=1 Tax=Funneliformis geosporum TaxID=1117311 RepID=A0A9W4SPQ4_9GLOM|nr:9502_t:CDS:2 [Funneliformis geosporum]
MVSKNKIICLFGYEKTQTVGDFCFREIGSTGFPLETQIEKYYSVGEVAKYVCAGLMLAVQIKEKYTPVNNDSMEMKNLHLDECYYFHDEGAVVRWYTAGGEYAHVRWYTAGGEYVHVRDCYFHGEGCGGNI